MPLRTAGRLVPARDFLDGHHEKYSEWSDRRRGHSREILSIVEMVSIDEAYLDLAGTERLHGPPLAAADKLLRHDRLAPLLFPVRAALLHAAPLRKLRRIKPNRAASSGPSGSEQRFLAKLPVRKIPGIGEVRSARSRPRHRNCRTDHRCSATKKTRTDFRPVGTALLSQSARRRFLQLSSTPSLIDFA